MAMLRRNRDSLGIQYDNLPQLPFWAPLVGNTQNWYKDNIAHQVIVGAESTGRGLTPEERDLLAHVTAKRLVTMSYEPPISMAVAYFMERRGRSTFKFPFWTPKPTSFDPGIFPSRNFPFLVGMVQGSNATLLWHSLRFGCYFFFAHMFGNALFLSYAHTVQAATILKDPRLGDFRKSIQERLKSRNGGRQMPSRPEDPSMQDAETPYGVVEDVDPNAYGTTGSDDGQSPAETSSPTGAYARSQRGYSPRQQPAPTQSVPPPSSEDFTDASLFDDASPVAPAARAGSSSYSSGGSAWDRVRQQSRSGNVAGQSGSASTPRSRSYGQTSDQYTYSKADEEKALAKDQAQKEFDAMLERERQGESDKANRRW
jgi:hypothetical protein